MLQSIFIPRNFIGKTLSRKGAVGQEWLDSLPNTVNTTAKKWDLNIKDTFSDLSYNFIVNVERKDGTEAVLKIGWKNDVEFKMEYEVLKIFGGDGMVKVFEYSETECAMLLENLKPGLMLTSVKSDVEATEIAAGLMKKLRRTICENHSFPLVGDWGIEFKRIRDKYEGKSGILPKEIFNKAEDLYKNLCLSQEESVLLHGDLHHYNILSAERENWLAIDPKGLIGEPAYEVGSYLRNPVPNLLSYENPKEVFRKRVDIFVELLGLKRERVIGWAFSQAVLSACWCLSENENESTWKYFIRCAEIFNEI